MEERKERVRAERSDKKVRVNLSLSKLIHKQLATLAGACGMNKTSMGDYLVELCLNNENIINFVQDQFKQRANYRVIPTRDNGKIKYMLTDRIK